MSIPTEDFEFVRNLVRSQTGVDLDATKAYLVESRLLPLVKEYGFASPADLIRQLRAKSPIQMQQTVVDAMMTHETMFFRDTRPFDCLRHHVLPELIKRRQHERRLSIWNAACSSGQEPYSVAMLIREYFPALLRWELKILASDVSQTVLSRAKEGRYSSFDVNRGLPTTFLQKYFSPSENSWKVTPDIRAMITFFQLNLMRPLPALPSFDLIMMRNVLIYFAPESKTDILDRVAKTMRHDGYLMLGGSETAVGLTKNLSRVHLGEADCYQVTPDTSSSYGTPRA